MADLLGYPTHASYITEVGIFFFWLFVLFFLISFVSITWAVNLKYYPDIFSWIPATVKENQFNNYTTSVE